MSIGLAEEAVNEVAEVAESAANGRLRLDIGGNLLDAVLGYLVVFIGLSLLMCVVITVGKIMVASAKKNQAEKAAAAVEPAKQAEDYLKARKENREKKVQYTIEEA